MRENRLVVAVAACAAALGFGAVLTGSAIVAALGGLASVAVAAIVVAGLAIPGDRVLDLAIAESERPDRRAATSRVDDEPATESVRPLGAVFAPGPEEEAHDEPDALGDCDEPDARGDSDGDSGRDAGGDVGGDSGQREPVAEASGSDGLTPHGLLGDVFLRSTLRGRVAVARRALRPLSVVHFEVVDDRSGSSAAIPASEIEATILATLRESDAAGRRDDGVYVFILEETGEDGAVWTAERLRRNLVPEGTPASAGRRFRAGVATYPNHGLDAESIDSQASAALGLARDWRRDRIEVAVGS